VQVNRVGYPQVARVVTTPAQAVRKHEEEINRLRGRITELENAIGKGRGEEKVLNDELQKTKILAGLTPVKGPGVVITLNDSDRQNGSLLRTSELSRGIIHDIDLQAVVHELFASGAEAVSVNGQRVVGRTAIRCVGPTVQINAVPISIPFVVRAIGNPDTLYAGLNLQLGVLDQIRQYDQAMVKMEKLQEAELPAYTESTEVKYAKPVVKPDGRKDQ
jgi:uncharacterized protein YlxW (UPF0749 family)